MTPEAPRKLPRIQSEWKPAPLILLVLSLLLSEGVRGGIAAIRYGLPNPEITGQYDDTAFGEMLRKHEESRKSEERAILIVSCTVGASMYVASVVWSLIRVLGQRHYVADIVVLVLGIAAGLWGVLTATGPPTQLGVV